MSQKINTGSDIRLAAYELRKILYKPIYVPLSLRFREELCKKIPNTIFETPILVSSKPIEVSQQNWKDLPFMTSREIRQKYFKRMLETIGMELFIAGIHFPNLNQILLDELTLALQPFGRLHQLWGQLQQSCWIWRVFYADENEDWLIDSDLELHLTIVHLLNQFNRELQKF